jgi:hypothetical protein
VKRLGSVLFWSVICFGLAAIVAGVLCCPAAWGQGPADNANNFFGDPHFRIPVATVGALPGSGNVAGDLRVAKDTGIAYVWTTSHVWQAAGGGAATSLAISPPPTLCSVGNYSRGIDLNGNATGCTLASGAGTVTSITAGAGLSGGTITTSGTIAALAATTSTAGIVQLATPSSDVAAGHVIQASDARNSNARTPTAHAATHQNGGSDEIATATPGANAIPKAGGGGTLATGWIPTLNQSTTGNAATSSDGLSSATGTAPLTLSLAAKAITGSLSVTPANSGGAVALQGSTPGTAQTGSANLSGTVIAGAFSGPLTGNVTGNVSGSSGSTTGTAANITGIVAPVNGGLGADNSATTGVPVFVAGSATVTAPTGSGVPAFSTSPTLTTPSFSGPIGTDFDLGTHADLYEIANAGTTGTTLNKLAKLTGAPSTAVILTTSDFSSISGVVVAGAGTTGNAQLARAGRASCVFDGATTAGDYVQASATVAGDCHDSGASLPTANQILGRVLSTNGSGGTYAMTVYSPGINGSSGGGGTPGGTTGQIQYNNAGAFGGSGATLDATGHLSLPAGTNGAPSFKLPNNFAIYDGGANSGVFASSGVVDEFQMDGNSFYSRRQGDVNATGGSWMSSGSPAVSATQPAWGFTGDTTTGMGWVGAGKWTLTSAGVETVEGSANGAAFLISARLKPQASAPFACAAGTEGWQYHNSTSHVVCICNGTSWVMSPGGTPGVTTGC